MSEESINLLEDITPSPRKREEPPPFREQTFERPMPNSVEAEKAILGAILLDNALLAHAIDELMPEDFYIPSHRKIYVAMLFLFENSLDINVILLKEELSKINELNSVGGISFISNLTYGLPQSAEISSYLYIVKIKSKLRQLIKAASKITSEAMEEDDFPEAILERAEKAVFDIANENTDAGFISARSIAITNVERSHALHDQGIAITGVPSGYADLDQLTLGWQRGDLIIIAARPSVGKTQFVINLALNAALRNNYRVGIFSLEMSKEAFVYRMLASEANIDSQRVRNGYLTPQEFDAIHDARDSIDRIQVNETPGLTSLTVRSKFMRLIAEQGLDFGIVDFLQLMSSLKSSNRNTNREQEVSAMSRELKAIALELDIPLAVVASVNRGPEQRVDHRPQLADLRESGNIEYAADLVAMLYREDYYRKNKEHGYVPNKIAEIILAKHRNGPTGIVTLRFEESSGRFDNLYQQHSPA